MANLGMADSLILMVIALVVFGPRRLPQIGRQIGKLMYEFRKASNDFKFQMEEELRSAEEADRRKADEERMRALAVTTVAPKLSTPEPVTTTIIGEAPPATTESPYPDEGVYPPVIPADAEGAIEEAAPRIQPPSTGEQVEASRPNRSTGLTQAANDETAKEPDAAASVDADLNAGMEPGAAIAEVEAGVTAEPDTPEAQPKAEAEQAAHHA